MSAKDSSNSDCENVVSTPEIAAAECPSESTCVSSKASHLDSLQLPSTITRLKSPEGSEVFLVGTAHFSKESQDDVTWIIKEVCPNVIVLELCKSRVAILQLDEETILEESKMLNMAKLRQCVRQHGSIQGIFYFLMLSVSAHITKELGVGPGGEFRAALQQASISVPNCQIQLGDRPISVTLGRVLGYLSIWAKMKLLWKILFFKEPITKEEMEKCKQHDFVEEILTEMTGEFPVVSQVFVDERDVYLTKSLQVAAVPWKFGGPNCSHAKKSDSPWVVVGVVGIGHLSGIMKNWGKVKDEDIGPIMKIPSPSVSSRLFRFSLKLGTWSILGFVIYKCVPRTAKRFLSELATDYSKNILR